MKTQYYTASSLDGFIATEDDSLEWLFSLADLGESSYPAFIAEVGALARTPAGQLVQINAGAVRRLDQRKAEAALVAASAALESA